MSEKINPNVEKPYNMGDPVFFYDMKRKEWKKGTASIRLGKTLYLRFSNFLRRVPVDKVRPDYNGEVSLEEGYAEHGDDDDIDEHRFTEEETPVKEMASDLGLAEENIELKKQLQDLINQTNVGKEDLERNAREAIEKKAVEELERKAKEDSEKKTKEESERKASVIEAKRRRN